MSWWLDRWGVIRSLDVWVGWPGFAVTLALCLEVKHSSEVMGDG